jgi:3-oxoacyl-(acyl-carrier-protein) reductase
VTSVTDSQPQNASPQAPEQKSGRVALVTGGNRGIGRGIAEQLQASGYRVAATHRSGEVPTGVLSVRCDITDQAEVEAAFSTVEAELGPVEVLVANAGITRDGLVMRMSDEDWDAVIDTNLTGAFRVARRAARPMIRQKFGRIIFVSSVVGLLGSAGQVNYAASKSGLVGLARSLARELGSRGVTSNVVAPGFIETEMTAELGADLVKKYAEQIPLGRMGVVDDVAQTIEFLAGSSAGYITGAVIPVDGGLGMGH